MAATCRPGLDERTSPLLEHLDDYHDQVKAVLDDRELQETADLLMQARRHSHEATVLALNFAPKDLPSIVSTR
ncbi:hypothetical protein [Kitasatospora sp. NPDC091207]|uniref:hypothetical protein n=1 Tax=Kitasatospora sp. NPDC091207 TaxID=3364083 RepID=UPI003802C04C